MRKLLIPLFLLTITGAKAQNPNSLFAFSALNIADSLKKNANAVYRLDEAVVEIQSPSRYNFKVHQIITLLNPYFLTSLPKLKMWISGYTIHLALK